MARPLESVTDAKSRTRGQAPLPSPRRVMTFRILAGLIGALFTFLAVSNMLIPWGGAQANPADTEPELHRWFTAASGAGDLIGGVCLVSLALRPRGRELLALSLALGLLVAALIVTPSTPGFLFLLLVMLAPLIAYPYRRDLQLRRLLSPDPSRVLPAGRHPRSRMEGSPRHVRPGLALPRCRRCHGPPSRTGELGPHRRRCCHRRGPGVRPQQPPRPAGSHVPQRQHRRRILLQRDLWRTGNDLRKAGGNTARRQPTCVGVSSWRRRGCGPRRAGSTTRGGRWPSGSCWPGCRRRW